MRRDATKTPFWGLLPDCTSWREGKERLSRFGSIPPAGTASISTLVQVTIKLLHSCCCVSGARYGACKGFLNPVDVADMDTAARCRVIDPACNCGWAVCCVRAARTSCRTSVTQPSVLNPIRGAGCGLESPWNVTRFVSESLRRHDTPPQ